MFHEFGWSDFSVDQTNRAQLSNRSKNIKTNQLYSEEFEKEREKFNFETNRNDIMSSSRYDNCR